MYYLQNGKIVNIWNIHTVPDTNLYPLLVQFSWRQEGPIFAVAEDGTVWQLWGEKASKITGIDNMKFVYFGNTMKRNGIIEGYTLSLISQDGYVATVEIDETSRVTRSRIHYNIGQALYTSHTYVVSSEGCLYELSDESRNYQKVQHDLPVILKMTRFDSPLLLSETGYVYDEKGNLVFSSEPVRCIYYQTILTGSGKIYVCGEDDYDFELVYEIPNPNDVIQLYATRWYREILYSDRTLEVHSGSSYSTVFRDIDCMSGQFIRRPRPKSANS